MCARPDVVISSPRHFVTVLCSSPVTAHANGCAPHHTPSANFLSRGNACAAFHTMFFADFLCSLVTCVGRVVRGMHLAK